MFWLCLLLLAWGQDNVAKVQGEWAALQLLRIEGELTRKVEEPIVIRDGPLEITITDGILVPVFSGAFANDRQANRMIRDQATAQGGRAREAITERLRGSKDLVGFVFTDATASARLVWQERADNLIFANHMVRTMGRPRDAFLPVADGEPWKVGVTEGIVLSIARAAGETAPLIFTALYSPWWADGIFNPIGTLSVLIYKFATMPYDVQNELAWAASFVLVMFILLLNLMARWINQLTSR